MTRIILAIFFGILLVFGALFLAQSAVKKPAGPVLLPMNGGGVIEIEGAVKKNP